jgi:inosine-uridine nucleoside N-ribohydrolase
VLDRFDVILRCTKQLIGESDEDFYVDPGAAEAVLTSGAPVTLVSLDATNSMRHFERTDELGLFESASAVRPPPDRSRS